VPDELPSLEVVLRNIQDPGRWADIQSLTSIIAGIPSVRGLVYGNVAEVKFAEWLVDHGIPTEDMSRDPDHAKTSSDRTIAYQGRRFKIQLKSMQTGSIRQQADGTFTARVQVDASDRREIRLPTGDVINTTCYLVGQFQVLAVPLQPFTSSWTFAFRLNETLPRSKHYSADVNQYLLKTLVDITYPLDASAGWSDDLFALLASAPDLGEVIEEREDVIAVRPPRTGEVAVIEEGDGADES
jgi:hypothetical protein